MADSKTLITLVENGAKGAVAIRSIGSASMTFESLRSAMGTLERAVRLRGIGRDDRVAILLPNGPDMAVAFLGTAAAAVAAPLNPAYKRDELDFYLADLDVKAMIVAAGETGPVVDAAVARGTPIIRLGLAAGDRTVPFRVLDEAVSTTAVTAQGLASPSDVALVLHTSGTTARPKQVPLTHGNLAASARAIATTLALTSNDAGLNVMPLFHIHGLVACLLAPLSAGGAVICTSGFNALKFMGWLQSERPTWYSAVPTMHQAILDRAQRQQEAARGAGLRFVRSSSASLPPQVYDGLGATFGCPVIEAYGMTEASHQMASNPLGRGRQRAGSVGIAAGPEIAIAGPGGTLLASVVEGEIVIRGASVMSGYVSNPRANAEAFLDSADGLGSWFRTGDLGILGIDGYLTISGRIKEQISRGGEKIAPREVDEVLMGHAAVAQAVTFGVPHPKLGEEVAAAVVLKDGLVARDTELRDYAAARLAAYKVPRQILIVDEIPKGPTGKLQRIGLAKQFGLA